MWFITVVVSPGDQAVQVGQAVGGGVEEHESVERRGLLTWWQHQRLGCVEEDNLRERRFGVFAYRYVEDGFFGCCSILQRITNGFL